MNKYQKAQQLFLKACESGNEVDAIKAYRLLTGCDLVKAKRWSNRCLDWTERVKLFDEEFAIQTQKQNSGEFAQIRNDMDVIEQTWQNYGFKTSGEAVKIYIENWIKNNGSES